MSLSRALVRLSYGSGPIATVTAEGPDSWSVTYPDDDVLGGSVTGDFRIAELEAYPIFPSAPEEIDAEWVFRDESQSLGALLRASRLLFDGMMRSDDRVMNCAGGVDPSEDREGFHECATGVLEEEFGG